MARDRSRLDDVLLTRGFAGDLKQARALILAGRVLVEGQRVDKAGTRIAPAANLRIKDEGARFASRGGEKLAGALQELSIEVRDLTCLDLGASTGGFTDCLLQAGARKVYAFDTGKGQLAWKLQQDSRVEVRDGVNVRYLRPSMIDSEIDFVVGDLSFISMTKILPVLQAFTEASVLFLVKPQFEARPEEVEPGGLILDPALRERIVGRVRDSVTAHGFRIEAEADSSLPGRKGNQEVFLYFVTEVSSS